MADTTTQDTTQDAQQAPDDTNSTEVEQTPTDAPDTAQEDEGKGGKSAVLADLAKERDRRQAAETASQEAASKLDAVLTALGIKADDDKVDPEQLANDLTAQRAENAVLRAGNGIADVDALLDSRNFTDSLRGIDSSDRDAVKAHITEYVAAHPRFAAATPQAHGVRDAAAGADSARLTGTPAQQFAKWSDENFG